MPPRKRAAPVQPSAAQPKRQRVSSRQRGVPATSPGTGGGGDDDAAAGTEAAAAAGGAGDDDDEMEEEAVNDDDDEEEEDDDDDDSDGMAEELNARGPAAILPALSGLAAAPSAEEAARYKLFPLKKELQRRKISAGVPSSVKGNAAAKALLARRLINLWDVSATDVDVSTTAMPELPAVEVRSPCTTDSCMPPTARLLRHPTLTELSPTHLLATRRTWST